MEEVKIANDEQRAKGLEKIDTSVKMGIRRLKRRMEEENRKILEEVGLGRLEDQIKQSLGEQKKMTENWENIKEHVKEVEHRLKEFEKRKVEVIGIKEVTVGMKKLEERLGKLEALPPRSEIKEIKTLMQEEMREVTSKVRELSKERVDRMETDVEGDDGEGSWSRVVKRGRIKRVRPRGPQVIVEPPERVEYKDARNELLTCLSAKDDVIRVRGIRKYKNNFIIEVHDANDLEILKNNPN